VDNDDTNYDAEFVFKIFQEIDQGLYTNVHFSHANVVMVSKEHYEALANAYEVQHQSAN